MSYLKKLRQVVQDAFEHGWRARALVNDTAIVVGDDYQASASHWFNHEEHIKEHLRVIEMKLCEQEKIVLRPDVAYVFSVDEGCYRCKTIAASADVVSSVEQMQSAPRGSTMLGESPELAMFSAWANDPDIDDLIEQFKCGTHIEESPPKRFVHILVYDSDDRLRLEARDTGDGPFYFNWSEDQVFKLGEIVVSVEHE